MAFNWNEFLNMARCLSRHDGAGYSMEAAYRTAVSRAYYAVFCHARNYARDRLSYVPLHDPNDHTGLRDHFRKRGMTAHATGLDQLRILRNQCDYDDDLNNIEAMSTSAIAKSGRLIGRLSSEG